MYAQIEKTKENKSRAVADLVTQKKNGSQGIEFVDNRPELIVQRKLQKMANDNVIQREKRKERGLNKRQQVNMTRMKTQQPDIQVDEGSGVMAMTLYEGYLDVLRNFDFSLARHWYPWLDSQGKEQNSIMHHNLNEGSIEKDSKDIGKHIVNSLWETSAVEPEIVKFTTSQGRKYQLDSTGSSGQLNHYFVISGPKVANVGQDDFLFYRALSKSDYGECEISEVSALYKQVEDNLSPETVAEVSGQNLYELLNLPEVKHFLDSLSLYLNESEQEWLPFSKLNNKKWDEPNYGQSIFNRSHKEIKKAYDKAVALGKLVVGQGIKPSE